jgi:hypothetical protein
VNRRTDVDTQILFHDADIQTVARSAPTTLLARLRTESGIALPMALGIMMVLSISLATVLVLSMSSEQQGRRATGDAKALALAEAGLNQAASVLVASTDPSVDTAIPAGSGSLNGGTSSYSGSLSGSIWTITGVGTVPNPVATGGVISRTASTQYNVSVIGTPWEWATFTDQPTGCMTIRNNAVVATALYVKGNLCLSNNAKYTAAKLYVGGTLTNSGSVGTAGTPITNATIVGGCTGGSPNPHPCTAADSVYASTISQTANTLSRPTVDLANGYSTAKPGPLNNCTIGSIPGGFDTNTMLDRSRAQFDLMPTSSYDCRFVDGSGTTVGQLSWNKATSTLTVFGVIFIDGDIYVNGTATYTGRASIYTSGKVSFSNNAKICGISGCTSGWDTTNNLILFVAGTSTDTNGIYLANGSVLQGAVYAVNDVYIDNNAAQWGPVIARSVYIDNNADQSLPLTRLPPGAPGISDTVRLVAGTWRG